MAQKYHTQILSEERSKDGRGVIIRERPVKCSGTADCQFCSSERRSRRPSKLDFSSYGSREGSGSRSTSVKDRLPTPFNFDYKPVRRSSRETEDRRRSGDYDHYYSDGEKMGNYKLRRRSTSRGTTQPIPIPKPTRSSSMYGDDMYDKYYTTSAHRSSDRDASRRYPPSRNESARVYPGYYDTVGPYGSSSKEASPRPSRPRRRHSVEIHQDGVPVSYGSTPVTNSYNSTPYGSYRSTDMHSRSTSMSNSLPKSVRWGDDPRAIQNAKIESRPSHRRSVSLSGAGTGSYLTGEVKSILKKPGDVADVGGSAPAVQELSQDQYAALYQSAQAMGVEDRATPSQRKLLKERSARNEYDSRDMIDNLRKRIGGGDRRYSFDMPPRRFSSSYGDKASGLGRRPEVFYDDRYSDRRW